MGKINSARSIGIACASGTFKGVFVHGVLSAFESLGLMASCYGGASSSTLSTTCAAIGKSREVGVDYWYRALACLENSGNNMSQAVLQTIDEYAPMLCSHFSPNMPRLIIAASAVVTEEAAAETQGNGAKKLGRKLLVSAGRGDKNWVEENLKTELFDTSAQKQPLDKNNFKQVAYASTRMLHAWDIPAWINEKPYIDASYTCSCPAVELAGLGYEQIIAIATEPGELYRDLFKTEIPSTWKDAAIYTIKPDVDIKEFDVDFTKATQEGLHEAYKHGEEKGKEFARIKVAFDTLMGSE